MVNRKWAYRELFDSEEEAARAYDDAVWRLKPKEAKSYINFKERFSGDRTPGSKMQRPRQLSSLRYCMRRPYLKLSCQLSLISCGHYNFGLEACSTR